MNSINKLYRFSFFALALACMPQALCAHERFILPSHTLLSGDAPQVVTLRASISNDIFHPDRPLGDSNTGAEVGDLKALFAVLQHPVINPAGELSNNTRWQAFSRYSVADVPISQDGTYRIALVQPELPMTTFVNAAGTPQRRFGKSPKLPDGASNIVRRTTASRVETFVSLNNPSPGAIKPVGQGLELSGKSHPNDLFVGEQAQFQLFYDGKPLTTAAKVLLIKGGTRHRNDRNEIALDVDNQGRFSFTPEQAGFYFLSAAAKFDVAQPAEVDVRHQGLSVTLEIFPE